MKFKTEEKQIHVYVAGGYVIAHVTRFDIPKDSYRVYKIVGDVVGSSEYVEGDKTIINVAGVQESDIRAYIPFGKCEIRGAKLVTDEAEVRRALAPFGSNEPLAEGEFNGTRLMIRGGRN